MKKGGNKNLFLIVLFVFGIFLNLVFVDQVFCYDSFIAHPGIAGLAVKAYNKDNSKKITAEQYEWIKQGSVDEDTPVRWLNHFYDPVYNRGLWFGTQHVSSKVWAQDPATQQNYANGDGTWQRAVSDYRRGDYENAFKELGQNIHLVSDALVPAHTRDDIHAPQPDSYENFVKNNWDNVSKDIKAKPIYKNTLDEVFDEAANYSNNNFYSDDSIEDKNYNIHQVIKLEPYTYNNSIDLYTAYVKDGDNDLMKSHLTSGLDWKNNNNTVNAGYILSDYAAHLLPKAIGYSAGTIKLFLDETQKNQPKKLPYLKQNLVGVLGNIVAPIVNLAESLTQNNTVKADTNNGVINQVANTLVKQVEIIGKQVSPKILPSTTSAEVVPAKSLVITPVVKTSPIPQISSTVIRSSGGGSTNISAQPVINNEIIVFEVTSTPTSTPDSVSTTSTTSTETIVTTTPEVPDISVSSTTSTPDITATSTTSTPEISEPVPDIVINEIAWAGQNSLPNAEYIELYNNTDQPIELFPKDEYDKWWKFKIGNSDMAINKIINTTIPAHGYYLMESPDDRTAYEMDADVIYFGNINDNGEDLQLINSDGQIVDEVNTTSTGWYAGSNVDYASMARVNSHVASNSSTNWQTSPGIRLVGGRAGSVNGSPKEYNFGPIVLEGWQKENVRTLKDIGYPYILTYYTVPVGKTLNIDPGLTIKTNYVDSKLDVRGNLNINGTTDKKVLFTSSQETPAANDWQGLMFYPGSVGNISGLDMRYAGRHFFLDGSGMWGLPVYQAVRADNATLSISDSSFLDNGNTTLYLTDSSSTIKNTSFSNGQLAVENYNGSLNLQNISVTNFSKDTGAIYVYKVWPEMSGIKFENNAGNDVMIDTATISSNTTIGAEIPMVWSLVTIASETQVDVDPGVTLKLPQYAYLTVKGTLNLNGTVSNPINILPIQTPSMAADNYWGRIVFDGGKGNWNSANISGGRGKRERSDEYYGMVSVNNGELTMNNCQILDGLPMAGNDLEINNSTVQVTNSTLGYVGTKPELGNIGGIWMNSGKLTLDNTTLMNLDYGIWTNGSPFPELHLQNMDTRNFVNVGQYWYPSPWYTEPLL